VEELGEEGHEEGEKRKKVGKREKEEK